MMEKEKEPTKKELETTVTRLTTELHMLGQANVSESIVTVLTHLIRWGGLVAIAYYMTQSIDALAGEETTSNIMISLITDLNMNQYLAYALGVGGTGYGFLQRKLKRDTIGRLQERNKALEKQQDPGRSSSKLTNKGLTRPEDQ